MTLTHVTVAANTKTLPSSLAEAARSSNVVEPLAERKHLRDLVIYEMHLDDFTDAFRCFRAPLDAVQDKLDYLQSLGINAILFMPWTAWKHRDFDWGYEPFHYFAVEYRYANDMNHPEEKISWLKRLISACHQRGIHVIMDRVFNHVSLDFPYQLFYLNPADCPYTGKFEGVLRMTIEHLNPAAAQITNDTEATSYWDNAALYHRFEFLRLRTGNQRTFLGKWRLGRSDQWLETQRR